jgi:hypothetical protein
LVIFYFDSIMRLPRLPMASSQSLTLNHNWHHVFANPFG